MGWDFHKHLSNLTSLKISSDEEILHGLAAYGSAEPVLGRQLVSLRGMPRAVPRVPVSSGAHPDLGRVGKVNWDKSSWSGSGGRHPFKKHKSRVVMFKNCGYPDVRTEVYRRQVQSYTDCHEEHLASFYPLSPANLLLSSKVKSHSILAGQRSLSIFWHGESYGWVKHDAQRWWLVAVMPDVPGPAQLLGSIVCARQCCVDPIWAIRWGACMFVWAGISLSENAAFPYSGSAGDPR